MSYSIPMPSRGVDVVSPEGSLETGTVRSAENVVIKDDGRLRRRPVRSPLFGLDGVHSLWRSPAQTRLYAAAGDTLYEVDVGASAVSPLYVGLPPGRQVEYVDVGPNVYATSGGLLLKIDPEGRVRRPGVADLLGAKPTLTPTVGSLTPGRYGVAYSLINDLGEESGVSSVEFVTLAAVGGILLSGIADEDHVARVRLYMTTANGADLYPHSSHTRSATASISDPRKDGDVTKRTGKQMMPGGEIVREFNGRLYVASGRWISVSDPLDYGLCDVVGGWMSFDRTITMLEPVGSGIFVGLRERVIFLRGNDQSDFRYEDAAPHGALAHSGTSASADFFSPAVVRDRDRPVAVWLSDVGLAVGRNDGSVSFPQEGRIVVTGGISRPAFVTHDGVKHGMFCVEGMEFGDGGARDLVT